MFETLKEWATEFVADYGYIGIFIISFTESIIQPVPPDPFITGGTAFGLNPLMAAFIAGIGSVLGGVVGYFLGKFLGEPFVKKFIKEETYKKGEKLFEKYGVWAVLIGAITPVPFKVMCWLAGIFEMPLHKFILAAALGRLPRFLAVAFLGQFLGSLK